MLPAGHTLQELFPRRKTVTTCCRIHDLTTRPLPFAIHCVPNPNMLITKTFGPERRAVIAKRMATVEAERREKEKSSGDAKPTEERKPEVCIESQI